MEKSKRTLIQQRFNKVINQKKVCKVIENCNEDCSEKLARLKSTLVKNKQIQIWDLNSLFET